MPVFSSLRGLFRPSAVASVPTGEVGYQRLSLPGWGSIADDAGETNPDLVWPACIPVYDRMRREDSQVTSVLRAVTLPIRRATWSIDPAGASPEVARFVAQELGLPVKGEAPVPTLRMRDRFSFDEHLRLALLELAHGHSVFEQVYRIGDDGYAHLRKLAWRPATSIEKFEVADDGGLVSVRQKSVTAGSVEIPVDRLVVYVNEREGAAWMGQSLLRSAYKMWLLKDRALRTQALTLERNGLGVPVYKGAELPEAVAKSETESERWQQSERDAGLKIAKNFRAGEAAGASIPHSADLELKGVSGELPDADKPIRYYDEQIARAVLAHFLNLGTETGSWALGSTFADFFTGSLNAVASHIADVAQQHVVEDLVDVNFGTTTPAPRLVCAPIGEEQAATAESIKLLIDSGAIEPDGPLEEFMRARYRLPGKDAETARRTDGDDAARARFAAETVQKTYLGVGPVLSREEARELARRAGAELGADENNQVDQQEEA